MVQWKKALSLVLAITMMLGLIPFNMNANAADEAVTVRWEDADGNELYRTSVKKGEAPVYAGEQPAKEPNAGSIYLFVGWSGYNGSRYYAAFPKVEESVTFKAEFDELPRDCTVIFASDVKNSFGGYDVQELKRSTYNYNTAGSNVKVPSSPTKASDQRYDYTFSGWELEEDVPTSIQTVRGDVVYRAHFTTSDRQYNVTWKNADGTVLSQGKVAYGETPSYSGTPAKASDGTYQYTFTGWQPAVTPVVGNVTYTATYQATPIAPTGEEQFTVTFLDANGGTLRQGKTTSGKAITAPAADPVKANDEQYSYTFSGWSPTVTTATGNTTFVPTFTANERTYTVKWKGDEDVELDSETGAYSTVMNMNYTGETPVRAETQENSYVFAGWQTSVSSVDSVITKKAQFMPVAKKYPIVFTNENGAVHQVKRVAFGTTPVADTMPTKAMDAQYTYTFDKWMPAVAPVSGSTVYSATYKPLERTYEVTFLDWDNAVLAQKSYYYSTGVDAMTGKPTPTRPSSGGKDYTFHGWSEESVDTVAGTKTYRAVYTESVSTYTITWKNDDGSILRTDSVSYDTTPSYDDEPTKAPTAEKVYTFAGWDKTIVPATQDETYTATYTESARTYTITWMNEGVLIGTTEVAYGDMPVYSGETPTKAPTAEKVYTFDGWTPPITAVTGEATYNATFKESDRLYTVTFKDNEGGTQPKPGQNPELRDGVTD